ncbi:MAG: TolC family protein [Bacteroidia bacterium]|nr:TolC family protein [Bacteroidia bacterium]
MKRKSRSLTIVFLFIALFSFAQQTTTATLSYQEFMSIVEKNHPVAKQADLITKGGDAAVLSARGNFDPKLFYDFRNKFYDGKNYFELHNGGFKIPTWFGIELKGGYEQNEGIYLNPENTMPTNGLAYSQISLPILQNLLIDERRSTLKQAKIFQEQTVYEKINQLNELLYKAGKAYWDWSVAYNNLSIFSNAVELSKQRLEAVKLSVNLGDRPLIDTVEASIQLQDRTINYQQALIDYKTKTLILSNYLWLENNVPVELTEHTIPENITQTYNKDAYILSSITKMDSIINDHPALKTYQFKLKQLSVEERMKKEKLKPVLNLNYNPLFDPEYSNNVNLNNYKWGVTVGMPIFLRKERGELKMTKIKIENTQYEMNYKKTELSNKVKATINEYNNLKKQIQIYDTNVDNYEKLWQSEKKLFDSGESSLFMINSRESSYINAQLKLNEIIYKNKKAALDAEYSFGQLNSIY